MRKFKMGIVTLATSAALFAPAGLAATSQASELVDISVGNIIVNPQVAAPIAANICNVDVVKVNALKAGDKTECKALSTSTQKAWITGR
jgi:hypothetical protein